MQPKKLIRLASHKLRKKKLKSTKGAKAKRMAPATPQSQVISDFTHIEQVTRPKVVQAVIVTAITTMNGLKNAVKQATMRDQNAVKTARMTKLQGTFLANLHLSLVLQVITHMQINPPINPTYMRYQ